MYTFVVLYIRIRALNQMAPYGRIANKMFTTIAYIYCCILNHPFWQCIATFSVLLRFILKITSTCKLMELRAFDAIYHCYIFVLSLSFYLIIMYTTSVCVVYGTLHLKHSDHHKYTANVC